MSDRLFGHEMWLSKLGDHLAKERYAAGTSRQCLAVARHFLRCLGEQHADVNAVQPADVEVYLQRAQRLYRRRHGHPPDYRGWRCLHTNGIHMLLRLVPRVHDLRHAFVASRMLAWYREGINPQSRLPYLATYLGHKDIHSTLVYLTVTQDLLQQASERFHVRGARLLHTLLEGGNA